LAVDQLLSGAPPAAPSTTQQLTGGGTQALPCRPQRRRCSLMRRRYACGQR
jgi:hypothetical protein